jgi:hypothetical protein
LPAVVNGAVADYAVSNDQFALSNAFATLTPGLTGIESGGIIGTNAGGLSALTVADNRFAAQASINSASNSLILDGAASISASAALSNAQYSAGVEATAQIGGAQIGVYASGGGDISNANVAVSTNSLSASASGNSASSSLTVQPVALNAGPVGAALTTGSRLSVSGMLNGVIPVAVANANNTLANQQENYTAINASVGDSNIGLNAGAPGAGSALFTSTATVGGNSAMASASGNSASNTITLASLPTGVNSSALVSNQLNTASVGASVSNVQIGVNAGGVSTSPVTISGNTISATAVGNSVSNHIGIGN